MPREADVTSKANPPALVSGVRRLASTIKAVFGMPDYARYLQQHRRLPPGQPALSPREHYLQWVEHRYRGGGLRCC
jgi:uncharacterized short protein YbdD (DUF466 family)